MSARIFRPAKTAMQSGKAATRRWRLEFRADAARHPDPLMGWTSLADTQSQVKLEFDTREEAVAYAKKHGIDAKVFEPRERPMKIKAYADNFAYNRVV
ncbi:MAG: ETC complex I subunit [Minwuia sp.]|uniref:ETC complex I subunit n=1 Tax=Minwuia sp. TaxID=2493630 RepID=UPI003A870CDE